MERNFGLLKVDFACRIVFPAKLRDAIKLKQGDIFDVVLTDDEQIILTRKQGACVLCGATDVDFKVRNGNNICVTCCDALTNTGINV